MKKIRGILQKKWIIVLILIGVLVAYQYVLKPTSNTTLQDTVTVKRGTVKEELTLSGEIDAEEKVILRFQTSGKLAYVAVQEGSEIKKGQYIASLDVADLKKKLEKELIDFKTKRWDLDQQRDDYKDKALTDEMKRVLEKAQFDVDNAILDVEIQQIANNFAHLYSPIDGVVTRVDTKYPGVNITPAQAEFEIINPKSVFLALTADQTEVGKISPLKKGIATLDSYENLTVKGFVSMIGITPKKDETNTVYQVKFAFDQVPQQQIRIGMTGDVIFTLAVKKNALYVPVSYVKGLQNPYVLVKKDGALIKQRVKTGIESETSFELLQGIAEGTTIYD